MGLVQGCNGDAVELAGLVVMPVKRVEPSPHGGGSQPLVEGPDGRLELSVLGQLDRGCVRGRAQQRPFGDGLQEGER